MNLWHGLLLITSIHLLAAASPGPDFVMVTQQTLVHGKRTGLWVSVGIALGLGVHIAYSILGLAAVIAHSLPLMLIIKIAGGCYLIYLGVQGLRARAVVSDDALSAVMHAAPPSLRASVGKGFLCNVLNPKAPIYFVALFTVVLSPAMPFYQLALYGAWMMLLQLAWFAIVTLLLSQARLRRRFQAISHWINRLCGAAMLVIGIKVLFDRN